VRRRLLLLAIPALLAGLLTATDIKPVLAAGGITETGTTTYEVVPSTRTINVTIRLSIYNSKPNTSCGPSCTNRWYQTVTEIAVQAEAGSVKVTSNAGSVKQTLLEKTRYFRFIKLTYPPVYYGQTRIVTATYSIPASPESDNDYRAGAAYASLCVTGNGYDGGTVDVVMPTGFDPEVTAGEPMPERTEASGKITLSSGTLANIWGFWSCVDADNPANLTSSSVAAGGQTFVLKGWPEDPAWVSTVARDVVADEQRLTDLTGMTLPAGTVTIQEIGDFELGGYAGLYNSATKTVYVTEDLAPSDLAHELSHIWFNHDMFSETWLSEGFAGYSEKAAGAGNYTTCSEPGAYPGTGSPHLAMWVYLDRDSTIQDENVVTWQYAASCYVITTLADAMGPAFFKDVVEAASKGEIAYQANGEIEESPLGGTPLSAKEMLDLFDELGMIPSGQTDLDEAQSLFARYGAIYEPSLLSARSEARAAYRQLVAAAGTWAPPLAVRTAMAAWDFPGATTAMATTRQILELRDQIVSEASGLSLDGSPIQGQFEAAANQADLDALLTLMTKESEAAGKYARARALEAGGRNPLQMVGLIGGDTGTQLTAARDALGSGNADQAASSAQQVIDAIEGSTVGGLLRLGGLGALLGLIGGAALLLRRRRSRLVLAAATAGATAAASGAAPPTAVAVAPATPETAAEPKPATAPRKPKTPPDSTGTS
jgi:hypothetical protein